jgi:hypothetical protein
VSCPPPLRWETLVAHRRRRAAEEPAAWPAALAHLRACAPCRRQALAADPTLVFQLQPEPEPFPEEAEDMRRRVAALRRAAGVVPPRRRFGAAGRVAAAAVLLLLALAQAPPRPSAETPPGGSLAALPAPADIHLLPVLEDLDRPQARVYELGSGDLRVVMIVDETLDV